MSEARFGKGSAPKVTIREYLIPTPNSGPYICVEGPDHCLWFCESLAGKIGRFNVDFH